MTLNNFRFYFNRFEIDFDAGVSYEVDLWFDSFSGSYSKTVFTLDLSKIIPLDRLTFI